MKRTTRLFLFVTALGVGRALVAQDPPIRVDFALRSATVESGVPVIITVTVRNDSDTDSSQLLAVGRYEVDWIVRSPDGAMAAQWGPSGDVASELTRLLPHAVRKFTIVAAGSAAIKTTGEYELTMRYRPLDVSERPPLPSFPAAPSRWACAHRSFTMPPS
ncbi:MAG: hypothetical protein WBL61_08645 [Bryobacteraceae bacterium]